MNENINHDPTPESKIEIGKGSNGIIVAVKSIMKVNIYHDFDLKEIQNFDS